MREFDPDRQGPLDDFEQRKVTLLGATKTVYMAASGPAVIVKSGAGQAMLTVARACISREFHAFASNSSSPVTKWLRALAAEVHRECGGKGVGAIGICFTSTFALSMMLEKAVIAPVLSQPSMPMHKGSGCPWSRHLAQIGAWISGERASSWV